LSHLAQFNLGPPSQSAILTLVAEVAPPTADGQVLQANSVAIRGRYAYVSYNLRGESFLGAIDVFDIDDPDEPRLVSEAIFLDSDIHSLTFAGGKVYAVQVTGDPSFDTPAAIESLTVNNGKLVIEENVKLDVPSFAGTSAVASGNRVYVASGNTGGLTVFDRNNLELADQIELHDARWVDVEGNRVVVVQGTPGQISVFNKNGLALLNSFPFSGAGIPESKSTVQVLGGKALIAAGTGGLQVLRIKTGEVVGTVPVPTVPGLDPSVVVTNAVSAGGRLVFISNGEAGVYLAEVSEEFQETGSEDPLEITLLGKLRFDNLQSVNHVAYEDEMLFVAAGLGGLKIVKVDAD